MKILDKVQEIFNQYELKQLVLPESFTDVYSFIRAYPEFGKDFKSSIEDSDLNTKYRKQIPKGWYGFDIGTPIIPEWMEIIDKIVALCIEIDPEFEIHQIKLKFAFLIPSLKDFFVTFISLFASKETSPTAQVIAESV